MCSNESTLTLGTSGGAIPPEFQVWQPPIIESQTANNCVAQVLSNIMECIEYQDSGKHIEYSVGYIYGNPANTTKSGMYPIDACKILLEYGDVERSVWECYDENPKCRQKYKSEVTDEMHQKARKIKDYIRIWTLQELQEYMLKYNLPVLINAYSEDLGGIGKDLHAVTCYGWNEKGLLFTNSYGTGGIYDTGKGITNFTKLKEIWGIIPMERNVPSDIKGRWSEKEIMFLIDKGIVKGYEDGTIRPTQPITREEVFVLISRILSE